MKIVTILDYIKIGIKLSLFETLEAIKLSLLKTLEANKR